MIKPKSQSALEFVLAFSIIGFLALGALRIAIWFNANYAKRQVAYEKDRLRYGQNATGAQYNRESLNLTENWIFKGESSGEVKKIPSSGSECIDVENFCYQKAVTDTRKQLNDIADALERMYNKIHPVSSYLVSTYCPPCCYLNCCLACILYFMDPCACYYCWLGQVLEEFCANVKVAFNKIRSEATGLRNCPGDSETCF
jgi:hypothetical protein